MIDNFNSSKKSIINPPKSKFLGHNISLKTILKSLWWAKMARLWPLLQYYNPQPLSNEPFNEVFVGVHN